MIKIFLSKEDHKRAKAVREFMECELRHNVNLNGAEYELLVDDSTAIDAGKIDRYVAVTLYSDLVDFLQNTAGEEQQQ